MTKYQKTYIFDLDKCLYFNTTENKRRNKKIKKLLKLLNGTKYIFSNATKKYVNYALKSMNIENEFKRIATKSNFYYVKPDKKSYKYVIKEFNIKRSNPPIFFDDKVKNLKTAKLFGWYTVLISPTYIKNHKYIDLTFHDIETAMNFFIMYNTYG